MSAYLPKIICGPVRRKFPTDMTGTANVGHGYRLKESKCNILKRGGKTVLDAPDVGEELEAGDKRMLDQCLKTVEFQKETDRKIKIKNVRRRVEQGLAAYEESVNQRREKLRDLILKEEMELTREVVDKAQRGDDTRVDEIREETEKKKKQEEEDRLAIVAAKRVQQYLARCPEVREKISQKVTIDAKNSNLEQMLDNDAKKFAETELDKLWHEITMEEMDVQKLKEEEKIKKRFATNMETAKTLKEQIVTRMAERDLLKQEREEEKKELAHLWELVREDETNKLKTAHEKREKLQKELEEQITISNEFSAERSRKEAELDRVFNAMIEAEIAKEKSDIRETSAALRREMLAYLTYLRELREADAKRDTETDAMIEEHNKQARAKQRLIKKEAEETRKRNLRDLIRAREEQMKEKREAEERERKMYEEEKILLERELERDAKLTEEENRKRWEESRLYKKELIEQMKYMEDRRNRDKEETERIFNDGLKREREYDKFMNELLNHTENASNLHPNKMVLKQYFEQRKAEQK